MITFLQPNSLSDQSCAYGQLDCQRCVNQPIAEFLRVMDDSPTLYGAWSFSPDLNAPDQLPNVNNIVDIFGSMHFQGMSRISFKARTSDTFRQNDRWMFLSKSADDDGNAGLYAVNFEGWGLIQIGSIPGLGSPLIRRRTRRFMTISTGLLG